jgi:hypothetical protein
MDCIKTALTIITFESLKKALYRQRFGTDDEIKDVALK